MKKTILLAFLMCIWVSSSASANNSFSTNASVSFWTNYMSFGQKLSSRGVINPEFTVTNGDFSFTVWQNYDIDTSKVNETDFTLNYNWEAKQFSFDIGIAKYVCPSSPDTREFYGTLTHKSNWSPSITVYIDDDQGDGSYLDLGLIRSWSVGKKNTLNVGTNISYNLGNALLGTNKNGDTFSGFYNAQIDLSLDIPVSKSVKISPKIGYTLPLTNDSKTAISSVSFGGDNTVLYGGISIEADFQ